MLRSECVHINTFPGLQLAPPTVFNFQIRVCHSGQAGWQGWAANQIPLSNYPKCSGHWVLISHLTKWYISIRDRQLLRGHRTTEQQWCDRGWCYSANVSSWFPANLNTPSVPMLITLEEWLYSPAGTTKAKEVKALYSLTANRGEGKARWPLYSLSWAQLCFSSGMGKRLAEV